MIGFDAATLYQFQRVLAKRARLPCHAFDFNLGLLLVDLAMSSMNGAKVVSTTRAQSPSVHKPLLVAWGLPELAKCRIKILRFAGLLRFNKKRTCECPAGQSCDFRQQLRIDQSESLAHRLYGRTLPGRANIDVCRKFHASTTRRIALCSESYQQCVLQIDTRCCDSKLCR